MRIFDGAHYEYYESDSLVLTSVFVLMAAVVAFLLDMLAAQLTCANKAGYSDKMNMQVWSALIKNVKIYQQYAEAVNPQMPY